MKARFDDETFTKELQRAPQDLRKRDLKKLRRILTLLRLWMRNGRAIDDAAVGRQSLSAATISGNYRNGGENRGSGARVHSELCTVGVRVRTAS
jgi:hypothetical protein